MTEYFDIGQPAGSAGQVVDLWGRLSLPRRVVETLAGQGSAGLQRLREGVLKARDRASNDSSAVVPEEEGRLSSPVQRRLSEATVNDLVIDHLAGSSIDSLAARLSVNRTRIVSHLDLRPIVRRKSVCKMTDRSVRHPAQRYAACESLNVVAARFDIDAGTLVREFRRAGVPIRRRRGWKPSN